MLSLPKPLGSLKKPVTIGDYIFIRLHQAGVRSIFGVPGDFNLVLLDSVQKQGLNWVGDANELNAGYAADGYARATKNVACVVTTFGVGELSAINAIAGAYSERVPVIHIVGCPSTTAQADGLLLHHTLGNGEFGVFKTMASHVVVGVAELTDPAVAAERIDEVIERAWADSMPVYIWLPTNMVQQHVEGARLDDFKLKIGTYLPNDKEKEDYVVEVVLGHLRKAERPIVLVDACTSRHRSIDEVTEFIEASKLPFCTSPMGKAIMDESSPYFCGIYSGSVTSKELKERVEGSDLVLNIGAIKSDFNTAGFTYRVSNLHSIDFHSFGVTVKYSEYRGVRMNGVLTKLAQRIKAENISLKIVPGPKVEPPTDEHLHALAEKGAKAWGEETITHEWLWPAFTKLLKPGDHVITETGTSNFGIIETFFPKDAKAINQYLWGSIGWATPAAQGVAMALRDMKATNAEGATKLGRAILWTGEGSFQLTAQSVGTMLRNDASIILFIINNDGYTIERFIHGMDEYYNDIQPWKYTELPNAFGAKAAQAKTHVVKTKSELINLAKDEEFGSGKGLTLVEVFMPMKDAPELMIVTSEAAAKSVSA